RKPFAVARHVGRTGTPIRTFTPACRTWMAGLHWPGKPKLPRFRSPPPGHPASVPRRCATRAFRSRFPTPLLTPPSVGPEMRPPATRQRRGLRKRSFLPLAKRPCHLMMMANRDSHHGQEKPMTRHVRLLAPGAALGLGLWVLTAVGNAADDKKDTPDLKEARAA